MCYKLFFIFLIFLSNKIIVAPQTHAEPDDITIFYESNAKEITTVPITKMYADYIMPMQTYYNEYYPTFAQYSFPILILFCILHKTFISMKQKFNPSLRYKALAELESPHAYCSTCNQSIQENTQVSTFAGWGPPNNLENDLEAAIKPKCFNLQDNGFAWQRQPSS